MIKVKNWSSLQSYKDRKPPWIRLHKSLLDDYEFHSMSPDARAILPMIWLLASEDLDPLSGHVKCDYKKIAFRLRINIETVTKAIQEIATAGFIELNQSCIETVTEFRNYVTPETETERETETEAYKPETDKPEKEVKKPLSEYSDDFLSFWSAYPEKSGKGDAWKSWQKLKPPVGLVLTALLWQVKSKKWVEGFIPNPSTYLNQRRWEDEPADVASISASKGAMGAMARAAALRKEQEGGLYEISAQ